jgi:uncharacterized protein (DUF1501 family)
MQYTGCLKMTREQAPRRDFFRVGSLGFLGIAAAAGVSSAKAQSVILLWLEGGPSHVDTWDPKSNSAFKAISTNVPGIQVSELLPQVARRMDKLAIVRSMHTKGNDHPQGTHYAITGYEPNPAMHFPSIGSIIAKETGPRNGVPPNVLTPQWERNRQYEEYFRAGARFVTAAGFHSNSWDTHSKNDEGHRDRLCPPLDRTLAALIDDLDERGLPATTVVIAMGEFGRTPFVNPDRGRDHYPSCWSLVMGGGGIKGGQVVGASDETGSNVTSRATSMGDVFATIYKAFGIDWTKEYDTPIGRPIKIANSLDDGTAEPIRELL